MLGFVRFVSSKWQCAILGSEHSHKSFANIMCMYCFTRSLILSLSLIDCCFPEVLIASFWLVRRWIVCGGDGNDGCRRSRTHENDWRVSEEIITHRNHMVLCSDAALGARVSSCQAYDARHYAPSHRRNRGNNGGGVYTFNLLFPFRQQSTIKFSACLRCVRERLFVYMCIVWMPNANASKSLCE